MQQSIEQLESQIRQLERTETTTEGELDKTSSLLSKIFSEFNEYYRQIKDQINEINANLKQDYIPLEKKLNLLQSKLKLMKESLSFQALMLDVANNQLRAAEYTIQPNYKMNCLLLMLAITVVVAAALVLAALYAPQHMPDAITAIVNNITPFYQGVITSVAYAAGAVALIGGVYKGVELYKHDRIKRLTATFFNSDNERDKRSDGADYGCGPETVVMDN